MDSQEDFTCNIKIADGNRLLVDVEAFSYRENAINILLGESGIGKTLISKALYGLLDPRELNVTIDKQDYQSYLDSARTKTIRRNSFFVFQEPSTHLNPLLRLEEQIREGSIVKPDSEKTIINLLWDNPKKEYVRSILKVYPKPHRPSGGEKQRILITMAFKKIEHFFKTYHGSSRNLFVFDEPSGNLDNYFRDIVLDNLIKLYKKRPFTILLITHDYSMISRMERNHGDLRDFIMYRELSLKTDGSCNLNDFSPKRYLNWIKQKKAQSVTNGHGSEIILKMKSTFRVFGKSFNIYKDQALSDLIIRKGEMAYLKAASGVGKTTLAKILSGLIHAEQIEAEIGGIKFNQDTRQSLWSKKLWGKKIGMVFQHADEALNLQASVKQTFERLPFQEKFSTDWLKTQLEQLFDFTIDEGFLHKKVKYLSGGQKQRINLLRSMSLTNELLILDEPLNGLDFESTRKVTDLLQDKVNDGLAVLMISHNEEIFDTLIADENVYHLREAKK